MLKHKQFKSGEDLCEFVNDTGAEIVEIVGVISTDPHHPLLLFYRGGEASGMIQSIKKIFTK